MSPSRSQSASLAWRWRRLFENTVINNSTGVFCRVPGNDLMVLVKLPVESAKIYAYGSVLRIQERVHVARRKGCVIVPRNARIGLRTVDALGVALSLQTAFGLTGARRKVAQTGRSARCGERLWILRIALVELPKIFVAKQTDEHVDVSVGIHDGRGIPPPDRSYVSGRRVDVVRRQTVPVRHCQCVAIDGVSE